MKVAIFSDVHANLVALERFVAATRGVAEAYLCLGDVVNYGPWNDECLEAVLALPGIVFLEGNHERLFLGREDPGHEAPLVQAFTRQSRRSFTRPDLIADLPREHALCGFHCSHTIGGQAIYADTEIEVDRSHIIGHSHQQYRIARSGHLIVNPGSVGQNRGRIDRVEYALFDTETEVFEFVSLPYDVGAFIAELRRRRYPAECVAYYVGKLG